MFTRITFDPKIMSGHACIRGMRIPVSVIVGQFAHGAAQAEILHDYPDLEPEDLREALGYAAWLTQETGLLGLIQVHEISRRHGCCRAYRRLASQRWS